jgi:hypothetical protein
MSEKYIMKLFAFCRTHHHASHNKMQQKEKKKIKK